METMRFVWDGKGHPPINHPVRMSVVHGNQNFKATIKFITDQTCVYIWEGKEDNVEYTIKTKYCTFKPFLSVEDDQKNKLFGILKDLIAPDGFWAYDDLAVKLYNQGVRVNGAKVEV